MARLGALLPPVMYEPGKAGLSSIFKSREGTRSTSYSLMVPVQLHSSLMQTASRASTSLLAALSGKA